jgi:hypothetical protein
MILLYNTFATNYIVILSVNSDMLESKAQVPNSIGSESVLTTFSKTVIYLPSLYVGNQSQIPMSILASSVA